MIDPRNVVMLTGGLVDVPERVSDNVVRFRLAVGFSSSDKSNPTGYYKLTYFLNQDNNNTRFVKSQLDAGNFKKGSQISIVGSLQQERWETDGAKRETIGIIADAIAYAGSRSDSEGGNKPAATTAASEFSPINSF